MVNVERFGRVERPRPEVELGRHGGGGSLHGKFGTVLSVGRCAAVRPRSIKSGRRQEGGILRSVRYFFRFAKMSSLFALKFRLF